MGVCASICARGPSLAFSGPLQLVAVFVVYFGGGADEERKFGDGAEVEAGVS